ncbi:hypothetical protein ACN47E_009681 [Coniothyrium glycines]
MRISAASFAWSAVFSLAAGRTANITLVPAATGFVSDNTAFVYGASPKLVANDGSAADGGFRTFAIAATLPLKELTHAKSGRSKVAIPIHNVGGRNIIVNIPAPDSLFRVFDAANGKEIDSNNKKQLGDWSTSCVWQSPKSGESYLYLFGKKKAVQFLVRAENNKIEILEVQTFPVPIEGESCSIFANGQVFFSAEDQPLYSFQAAESTSAPVIRTAAADIKVAALATYHANANDFLFVAHDEVIDVYNDKIQQVGSFQLGGILELFIEGGLSVLQSSLKGYPSGVFAFAFEGEDDTGVAFGSLDGALESVGIKANTSYNPAAKVCSRCMSSISKKCSNSGFTNGDSNCSCFPGFAGKDCSNTTCENNCSGHGECNGPNVCKCEEGWAGPSCSFVAVQPKFETEANGGDGDDPAIWIHPTRSEQSKIITTTKSEDGEGFGVFNLQGKLLQHVTAQEPNNVDIIYNFTIGTRKTDLAFAACRGDNTMCLVEINSTGFIQPVAGGTQALPDSYEPYGSCNYRSLKTGKEYLFVNNKAAKYLQYELLSTPNGTLQTTLVREFQGGSGGQVEGCVVDEAAGFLFLGEEPSGIWRYDAEPTGSAQGTQIAKVGDANGLQADVEGITLVPAKSGPGGYIIVSSQGISSYFVYERAAPHEYVLTFTIVGAGKKGVDGVSNTDGIAAVGNALNRDFPFGLVVTHDDANQLAGGGTAKEASFKLTSLVDVLGEERARKLGY